MMATEYLEWLPHYLIGYYKIIIERDGKKRRYTQEDYNYGCIHDKIYVHALIWTGDEVIHARLLDSYIIECEDWYYPYRDQGYYGTECLEDFLMDLWEWGSYEEGLEAIKASKWGDGFDLMEPIYESYYNQMVRCWSEREEDEVSLKNSDWVGWGVDGYSLEKLD